MAEALIRIRYVAYVLPILKAFAESDPYDHRLNKDLVGELQAGACRQKLVIYLTFPPCSVIRKNNSSPEFWPGWNSCRGLYTAFDLLKERYWTNTHYGHGSQQTCMSQAIKYPEWHETYWDHDVSVCLPGRRVPGCFRYRTTKTFITLELPPRPDLLGFAFCLVLSPENQFAPFRCDLYIQFTCICLDLKGRIWFFNPGGVISEHVFLCHRSDYDLLKALKEHGANDQGITGNLELSFEVYFADDGRKDGIKEWGVLPLYASDIEHELSTCVEEKEIEDTNKMHLCSSGHRKNEHQPHQIEE